MPDQAIWERAMVSARREAAPVKTKVEKGKTGRKCVLCTHPRREALNQAIAMGELSMGQVAAQIGVHKSSISRHFRDHLQPAMAAAGGGATLPWSVRTKSRELTVRMEEMLNAVTCNSATGRNITKRELLENWQAIRAMGMEMREWMRLHGQATGELMRDGQNNQVMSIQIVCPSSSGDPAHMPRISYSNSEGIDSDVVDIGIVQRP